MTRETTMICDACSRVIDGVNSALAETLRGPSGDDAVDLCDRCVDAVREFLKQKREEIASPFRAALARDDAKSWQNVELPDALLSAAALEEKRARKNAHLMALGSVETKPLSDLSASIEGFTVTPTGGAGIHSGRPRFRVVCNACGVEVHKETTGPEQMARAHERECSHGALNCESLNFDAVTSALAQPQDAPVFKPGKPIKPTVEEQEPWNPNVAARNQMAVDMIQKGIAPLDVPRIMEMQKTDADLRLHNLRLECDVARLEGVIEGMNLANEKPNAERTVPEIMLEKMAADDKARRLRDGEISRLLPMKPTICSLLHPNEDATVYLVFGKSKSPVPDVVNIYGDEKLTAAAVADLIRTRAKPEPEWLSDEEAAVRARGVDRDFDPGWPR